MKALYYIRNFSYHALPESFFRKKYKRLKSIESSLDPQIIDDRLNYYFKPNEAFPIPPAAVAIQNFKRTKGTGYYFDLKEFLHYFNNETRFAWQFGDDTFVLPYPTLFKARPIIESNANSILFKLNKHRHFAFYADNTPFRSKANSLVWRGGAYGMLRRDFVRKFYNHPLCDVGQCNSPAEDVPWQKPVLSVQEQLKHKFILSLEGNDVATNLKWVMASNSLCFMPKPKYETWFMEGRLEAGKHYVEINAPYEDLEQKIEYYSSHPDEAEAIIQNAKAWTQQFRDKNLEDLLCLKVLEKYAALSGQKNSLKFK
jgi:hypothetical protein